MQVSQGIVGRLMADPAFMQKMLIEQIISVGTSLALEARQRRENFAKELDLVVINTACVALSTGALVWLMAPNRAYGAIGKMPWQKALQGMPNNVFDASTPYKKFSMGSRVAGGLVKTAELCAVGSVAGAAMSGLSQLAVKVRRQRNPDFTPSVPIPELGKSSQGMGLYMAASANVRYQLVSGIDRGMFDRFNVLWMYLLASSSVRLGSNLVGEASRRWLQGIPDRSPVQQTPQPTADTRHQQHAFQKQPAVDSTEHAEQMHARASYGLQSA